MKAAPRTPLKYWAPLAIVLAVLAAHGGALDSTFYLDDFWQTQGDVVIDGLWYAPADSFAILPNLTYYLTWKAFGFSAFWFHLGNLLLHLAGALAVYYPGRYLLAADEKAKTEQRPEYSTIAFVAALIFATHPLTTEMTNYVKARDHGLVGFFSFLVAAFAALGMQRNRIWFLAAGGAIGLAAISKGPGLPQAVFTAAVVVAGFSTKERWRRIFPNRWILYALIFVIEIGLFFFTDTIANLITIMLRQVTEDWRFGWHALTQCRAFWAYTWLAVWPAGLCSDHLFAWTKSVADVEAWTAAGATLAVLLGIVWLWVRRLQPWAMLATLAAGTMLLRFLYVVSELMVEYRTYPAMFFVALLIALGIARWWRHMPRTAVIFTVALVSIYSVISYLRSEEWNSEERLYSSILKQYPWQLRAMNGQSWEDVRKERWQRILDRQPEFSKRLAEVMAENKRSAIRYYENWPLWAVSEESMVAEALLHVKGPDAAEKYINALGERMKANRLDHIMLWTDWYFVAGKIAAAKGDKKKAAELFRKAYQVYPLKKLVVDEMNKIGEKP